MTAKELFSKIVEDLSSSDDRNYSPSFDYIIEGFGKGITSWVKTGCGYVYSFQGKTTVEYANFGFAQIVIVQENGQTTEDYAKELSPWKELKQKWKDCAEASGVAYYIVYNAFKTAIGYTESKKKDEEYWCDVYYERCCKDRVKNLIDTDWDDYPDITDSMKSAIVDDLNYAYVKDKEIKKRLKKIAKGRPIKTIYLHAVSLVMAEVRKFKNTNNLHPIDYALSMPDDIEVFSMIEADMRSYNIIS